MINQSLPSELQLIEFAKNCPYYGRVPEFYTNEDRENFYGTQAFTKYAYYWAYSNYFKPESMVEIGVRYGYSLLSLILGCTKKISVFTRKDNETNFVYWIPYTLGIDNGAEGNFNNVQRWESEYGFLGLHLYEGDSKNIATFNVNFDLAHVDGDHSKEGCLNDVILCWKSLNPGGILIVDDYIAIGTVREALDIFLKQTPKEEIQEHSIYNTVYGGHILIKKSLEE